MSKCWQLSALMRKNLILMKRSYCYSCCEIFSPLILMLLMAMIRRAAKTIDYTYNFPDTAYFKNYSDSLIGATEMSPISASAGNSTIPLWNGLNILNPL